MRIGVLALQGAIAEHIESLTTLNVEAVPVKLPSDLDDLEAIVIPGGESTTVSKLLSDYCLFKPLRQLALQNFPIFGTCAGMVLMAKKVFYPEIEPLGVMDIQIKRNAFGSQVNSFEVALSIPVLGCEKFHGVFIRAPVVQKAKHTVEVLCRVEGNIVAVKQGKMLACSFHPELSGDLRFHNYFLDIIKGDDVAN